MSNSLDPDQDRQNVGPDLGPNCLQRLLADNKSLQKQGELKMDKTSSVFNIKKYHCHHVQIQRGGGGGVWIPPPLKNHKNIGFLCNTAPNPLKNHKATKIPRKHSMLGHHRPASETPLKWRFAGGPMIASLIPHQQQQKKTFSKLDPLLQNIRDPRIVIVTFS